MTGTEQERGRRELVDGLSHRFVKLRRRAGLTQQGVADAMGKSGTGRRMVGRLERGAVSSASLVSLVEYLRAVRAGFGDLKDVLDSYASLPIPEPRRKLAASAPLPRVQTRVRTWENGDSPSERADARYSPRFPDEVLAVLRVRRRAGYWVLRKVFEHFLHTELSSLGISPCSWVRRRIAQYARKVFNALYRTRGKKETIRQERLARCRAWAERQCLVAPVPEYFEAVVKLVFEDMAEHDELDWMPPPDEAFDIMAVKPKHRVVTDAQMCMAEWSEVFARYSSALMAVYERTHKAALEVAESERCDARTAARYKGAAMRATNIARTTAPDTPVRKQSVALYHSTQWPTELDRELLGRVLEAALAVWDDGLPTLPPAPGPRPG